jgi:hypothetical protein
LSPVVLLDPDTLHGQRLIASTPQTLIQVAQVLVEALGLLLGRHSIDPRCPRLTRGAIRFA